MLDDLSLFVAIANAGNLKKTSEILGIPAATVTRRLQNLEYRLNCQLIHRSARLFCLTIQGEALLKECGNLLGSLEERLEQFNSTTDQLAGKIKLLAPSDLARGPLSDVWSSFLRQYPQIELEFVLDNKVDDLRMGQADFAIRIGPQHSSALHQQRIASINTVMVAAPDYVQDHGHPQTPEALIEHWLVVSSTLQSWDLRSRHGDEEFVMQIKQPRATVNEIGLAKQLVIDATGISLLPFTEVYADLQLKRLVQVLPDWEGQKRDMYIIWASGKHLNRRSRYLIKALKEYVSQNHSFEAR